MNFIEKALSEGTEVSCMRIMSLISLFVSAVLAFYTIFKGGSDIASSTPIISVFVGAAFGGKLAQKHFETSQDKTNADKN